MTDTTDALRALETLERGLKAEHGNLAYRANFMDSIEDIRAALTAPAASDANYIAAVKGRRDFRESYRKLRAAIKDARYRLAKGRALWNGPCHECDGVLAEALNEEPAPLTASAEPEDELDHESIHYTLLKLCDFLGVDANKVTWDAATETVEDDVQAVIGNILRAKFGEEWGPG